MDKRHRQHNRIKSLFNVIGFLTIMIIIALFSLSYYHNSILTLLDCCVIGIYIVLYFLYNILTQRIYKFITINYET
jgi:hypothetical protein